MHHRVDRVRREDRFERGAVAQVGALEFDHGPGGEFADALEHRGLGVAEVVHDHQPIARRRERDAGVRSDVAESARDENH